MHIAHAHRNSNASQMMVAQAFVCWMLQNNTAGGGPPDRIYTWISTTTKMKEEEKTHTHIEIKGIAKSGRSSVVTHFQWTSTCKSKSESLSFSRSLARSHFASVQNENNSSLSKSCHHLQITVRIPFRFWCPLRIWNGCMAIFRVLIHSKRKFIGQTKYIQM